MNRTLLKLALAVPLALALSARAEDAPKDVVDVAVASKDHSTLVTAVKAADLVVSLKNPGPFTVFAPTNAAFDKLPKGTVEGLLKPEKKDELANILKYHVTTTALEPRWLQDGEKLGMANGGKVEVKKSKDGKLTINGANVVAQVRATNGMVMVIDQVLLPPAPAPKK